MPFDPKTAKKFDPSTAKRVEASQPSQEQVIPGAPFGAPITPTDIQKFGISAVEALKSPFEETRKSIESHPESNRANAYVLARLPGLIGLSVPSAITSGLASTDVPVVSQIGKALNWAMGAAGEAYGTGFKGIIGAFEPYARDIDRKMGIGTASPDPKERQEAEDAIAELKKTGELYTGLETLRQTPGIARGAKEVAKQGIGAAAERMIPESFPTTLETKAIKQRFAGPKGLESFESVAKTALKEDVKPTRSGLEKASGLIDQITSARKKSISGLAGQGATVDFKRFDSLLDRIEKQSKQSDPLYETTKSTVSEIRSEMKRISEQYPNRMVPIDVADAVRANIENIVAKKYGEVGTVKQEIYKGVAHDLVQGITEHDPNLRALGLRDRDLINLKKVIENRLANLDKRDILPRGALLRGVITGWVTGNPGLGAIEAVGEIVLKDPAVIHHIAKMAQKLRGMGITPKPINPEAARTMFRGKTPPPKPEGGGGMSGPPIDPNTPRPVGGLPPEAVKGFTKIEGGEAPKQLPSSTESGGALQSSIVPGLPLDYIRRIDAIRKNLRPNHPNDLGEVNKTLDTKIVYDGPFGKYKQYTVHDPTVPHHKATFFVDEGAGETLYDKYLDKGLQFAAGDYQKALNAREEDKRVGKRSPPPKMRGRFWDYYFPQEGE